MGAVTRLTEVEKGLMTASRVSGPLRTSNLIYDENFSLTVFPG